MSFVQRLRMANMFPVRPDNFGNARADDSGDEMNQVIEAGKKLALFNQHLNRPNGMQMIGQNMRPSMGRNMMGNQTEGLRFGGVIGGDSNPGAIMNARAGQETRDIYEGYKQPLNSTVSGPSNDEINLERYFDRKNRETIAEGQAAYRQNQGWKTVTTVDPNDPSKQVSVQVNDRTGDVRPLELPGNVVRPGSAKDIQAGIDAKNKTSERRNFIKEKTQGSLDLLAELLDDKGQLTHEAARSVGKSSWGNIIPTTEGYSGSTKINRLKNERILDLLKELKEQSKTGATGMGNMSNKDLSVLEKSASMLDTGLDENTFRNELIRIKDQLNKVMQDDSTDIKPTVNHTNAPQAPNGYEYIRRPDGKGWTAIKKVGK